MASRKRTVLVTGCTEGSAGHALAREFHAKGFEVYATARSTAKMASLQPLGIRTLPLDITSDDSIQACVQEVPQLDILVNNAGASLTMPIVDLSIQEAKALFDANVWGHLAVIQAFLPLLLKSPKAMIVNHTSVAVTMAIPYQAVYNASKACLSSFSDTLRLELQPFDIAVVELRSGGIKTNIFGHSAKKPVLPAGSIYAPARETVETSLRQEWFADVGISPEQWAREIVRDLSKKHPPPRTIWRGESAFGAWLSTFFPSSSLDANVRKMVGFDKAEQIIRERRK
ncbi:putative short-chain dehydrogenase [Neohortaea acidophila]|uniref:Putative short-chain dehydrogenase n=1 Tax=Neohortaea acidophila TaxID=245834 RepID=A0A6A6PXL4_9PEZI|nr:putative short-chain dehydrogenase [Neohortaea acidophila]KAF2484755.1 putative short-chain dehydrogenase [Neohortaea acidophila]